MDFRVRESFVRSVTAPRLAAIVLALVASGLTAPSLSGANTNLHTFAGEPNDGRSPAGGLTLSGNFLYGTTRYGGTYNNGTLFRMKPDGSDYTIIHHFAGGAADGDGPRGKLLVVGSTIYGTTFNGGPNNLGTVYTIQTNGLNFTLLHVFPTGSGDGTFPCSPLVLVNSTLYGTTTQGGADNLGTVFVMNTDGTGYARLHEFVTGPTDGHLPFAGLTLAGSSLYGVTAQGGNTNNAGTVFKIDLNGNNYVLLHQFTGIQGDGFNPENTLTLLDSTLYGVTNQGGTAGTGTIFKIDTGGSGYGVLYSFEGTSGNDGHPSSPLAVVDDHLIGATDPIDSSIPDLVYSIGLDGSGFGVLYRFNGSTSEGREPGGDFAVIGSVAYGVTAFGGSGNGVVYSLDLPTLRITSLSHPQAGQFSLTGQSFPNSTISIAIIADLQSDPLSIHQIMADSNGVFQFTDSNAGSKKFYRAMTP
jgi:uncharacterized repeat protein (TIGR03803 family)